MNQRVIGTLLALITLGALGFAAFIYFNNSGTTTTQIIVTPTPQPSALSSDLASPLVSTSPNPSATPTPNRSLSASQPLTVPSEVTTLPEGGSLFQVATDHSITVADITKINGISNADNVVAGQTLILPDDVNDTTYTFLFIVNKNRQTKEEQKLKDGGTSLYSDPISAAQTDTKGIFGLKADTPYSKTSQPKAGEPETTVTLSTSDDEKIITLNLEKTDTGLWLLKKMAVKFTKKDTP